jgi:hypothetical protein
MGKATKADSMDGATSQTPKAGQEVDLRADILGQRAAFKTELPHITGGRN